MKFQGHCAFPITPSDEDGRVDTENLGALLAPLMKAQVNSIGLLGSTGTYAYLTRKERLRAIHASKEVIKDNIPLMVGIGALRTDEVCVLAREAESAGANALLLAPVSYTPLTDDEVFAHFKAVNNVTGCPICIYNNPSTTHFNFGHDLIQRLATLSNIKAIKNPFPSTTEIAQDIQTLRKAMPETLALGYSGDWGGGQALLCGADTWYSVIGGIFPQHAQELTRAAQTADAAKVNEINAQFAPLWSLLQKHGSLRVCYAIAHLRGLTKHTLPRPILPLDQDVIRAAAKAIADL